ncbi:O-antigen ligase family protein [Hymenobacter sp. H14-R3]|uniref:O-antigen ligase family protein n=1 Tax=Hymenobacter sp. H14-R3 TaxID=3046308 RepID=UPI0024BA2D66|nr:O-antigen ligase family protein [Hymenobacter sp. H14-R3]MDJ0363739.1 O-antigen ligase family protein [Hymenobacter sp. H14-R3]
MFSETSTRRLSVFWSAIIILGLFVTRWILILPSIGIAGLFLTGVAYAIANKQIAQRAHARTFLSLTIIYGIHFFFGLCHNNLYDKELLKDLVLQLPFLLLPLSFLLLPTWRSLHKRIVWTVVITCCLASAIGATTNYSLHLQEIVRQYDRSQVMPTEPDHVRFSILISISILSGCVLLLSKELATQWRITIGIGVGLLFLFQHLLAVRSGLLSLYFGGILLLVGIGWQLKRWKTAATSIVLVVGVGLTCLWLFPTLQLRIHNTLYDTMQRGVASSANNFSVTARLYSYEVAETIIQKHLLLGVGKARLEQEMAQQYSYRYPEISVSNYLLPHNQFIYNLAAYGVVGLAMFLYGFYYPLWIGVRQHNLLAIVIYAIITISFLSEYTLENNLGIIIGLFFALLALAPMSAEVPSVAVCRNQPQVDREQQ